MENIGNNVSVLFKSIYFGFVWFDYGV